MVGCFGANSVPSFLPPNPLVSHAKLITPSLSSSTSRPIHLSEVQFVQAVSETSVAKVFLMAVRLFQKTPLIIFAFTANSVPNPLVSHVKIILPMIIVNININPCLCVLAIFSSVSQNKISHHSYEKALANTNAVVLSKTSVMKRIQQMSLKGDKKPPSRCIILQSALFLQQSYCWS